MPLVMPTSSKLQCAVACSASVVMERVPEGPQSPSAKRGSLIGAVIASELRGWPKPDVGRHRLKINMPALRAFLGEGDIRCEAAMSLSPAGVVEDLSENIGRAYNRPGCINGAADIVVARRHALCLDIKSGSFEVPQPDENWQVSSLSAMLAVVLDGNVETVTGVIAKLGRDGEWDFGAPRTWTLAELAGIRARLVEQMRRWREDDEIYQAGLGVVKTQNAGCFFCRCVCEHSRVGEQREAA